MAILTDSMSLIQALRNKSTCTKTLRNKLEELSNNVGMLLKWVPGHKDIPGNELADKYAKEAASAARAPATNSRVNHEDQEKDITVSYNAARSYIKRKVQDGPIKHARTAAVYKNINRKRDLMVVKNRKEGALLAELRSGHCLKLQEYRHRIGLEETATCPICEEEDQDVEHWLLRCPGTLSARQSLFDDVQNIGLGSWLGGPFGPNRLHGL